MTASDPIHLMILSRALIATAEEMGANLVRSAFSTVVRESRDCSTAILDIEGNVVAQAEMIPIQTAGLGISFKQAASQLDLSRIGPQNAILLNDPFSGGQHLNDIILFQPIFEDSQLLGWVGNTAHHLDIGGGSSGVNTQATELIQEGLIIPPIVIDIDRDWYGGVVERLIFANIRTAEIGLGDINAQFAANHIGIERIRELARREGADVLKQAMDFTLEYGERRMRAAIGRLPQGQFLGEAFIDRDVFSEEPIRIRVKATIRVSEIELDFEGTSPQVKGMFNCPLASAVAAAMTGIRSIFNDEDFPVNDGCSRAVKMRFPTGSVINPSHGAPVRARMQAAYRTMDAVHASLAQASPDRVSAQGFNSTTSFYITQAQKDGTSRIYVDLPGGGYGAAMGYDGAHAADAILGSCRRVPVESVEQVHPHLLVKSQGIVPNSCGAGEWQGGLGYAQELEIVAGSPLLNFYCDHFRYPPKGSRGGCDGSTGSLAVIRDGRSIELGSFATFQLQIGDAIQLRLGGGAGWGAPEDRTAAAVRDDLSNGYITLDFAQRHYAKQLGLKAA